METQSLVTIVPWTFIATILNLFLTMLLVKKFLFKPINRILEQRQALSEKELTQARAAREEADGLKTEYESSLAEARSEAAVILQNAQKEAQAKADQTIRNAEQQAAGIRSRAEADIAQEKKKPSTKPRMRSADLPWTSQERSLRRRSGKRIIRS